MAMHEALIQRMISAMAARAKVREPNVTVFCAADTPYSLRPLAESRRAARRSGGLIWVADPQFDFVGSLKAGEIWRSANSADGIAVHSDHVYAWPVRSQDGAGLKQGSDVISGDVVVNDASPGPTRTLTIDLAASGFDVQYSLAVSAHAPSDPAAIGIAEGWDGYTEALRLECEAGDPTHPRASTNKTQTVLAMIRAARRAVGIGRSYIYNIPNSLISPAPRRRKFGPDPFRPSNRLIKMQLSGWRFILEVLRGGEELAAENKVSCGSHRYVRKARQGARLRRPALDGLGCLGSGVC